MRLALTAGFDRALHAVALLEELRRAGHTLAAVIVVTPFDVSRARALVRQRGMRVLSTALRRIVGARAATTGPDEMADWVASHGIEERSLSSACRKHGIPHTVVRSLNDEASLETLRRAQPDRVIYAGGGILKSRFLQAAGEGVLNAHSGPLPEIRGMNACEWSLLLRVRPAVTIHVIDAGIDTGPVLEEIPLPVRPGDTIDRLRSRCTVLGVEGMLRAAGAPIDEKASSAPGAPGHRQCYVLAPALKELLEARLARP